MKSRLVPLMAALCLAATLAPAAPVSAVTVTPVTAAALKKTIAGYRGHVVLVNFWATWCLSCMDEYPGLTQLSRRYKSRGLVVLAVSGDAPRDIPGKVMPFLARQKPPFPQFILRPNLDTFVNAFQPSWQEDFPQTFVYNRQGRLVHELGQEQTVASWQAAIVPLLYMWARGVDTRPPAPV